MNSLSFDFDADRSGDFIVSAEAGPSKANALSQGDGPPEAFAGQLRRFVVQQADVGECVQKDTHPSASTQAPWAPEPTVSAATWTTWLERYVSVADVLSSQGPDAGPDIAAGAVSPEVGPLSADGVHACKPGAGGIAYSSMGRVDAAARQIAAWHLGGQDGQFSDVQGGRVLLADAGAEMPQTDADALQSSSSEVDLATTRALPSVGSGNVAASVPAGADAEIMCAAEASAHSDPTTSAQGPHNATLKRVNAIESTAVSTPRALEVAGARAAQDFTVAAEPSGFPPPGRSFWEAEVAAKKGVDTNDVRFQKHFLEGGAGPGLDLQSCLKLDGETATTNAPTGTESADSYAPRLYDPNDDEVAGDAMDVEVADDAPAPERASVNAGLGPQKSGRSSRVVPHKDSVSEAGPTAGWDVASWQAVLAAPPGLQETDDNMPTADNKVCAAAGLNVYRHGALSGRSFVDSGDSDGAEGTKTAIAESDASLPQQAGTTIGKLARTSDETSPQDKGGGQRDAQNSTFQATATAGAPILGGSSQGLETPTGLSAQAVQHAASGLASAQPVPVHRISDQLAARINEGARRIELRVAPPGLGALDIAVQVQGNQVNLTVRGEAPDLSKHLQRDMGELQRNLAQHGLDLGHTDFGGSGTASEGQREGSAQGHASNHNSTHAGRRASVAAPAMGYGGASVINVVL